MLSSGVMSGRERDAPAGMRRRVAVDRDLSREPGRNGAFHSDAYSHPFELARVATRRVHHSRWECARGRFRLINGTDSIAGGPALDLGERNPVRRRPP